MPDCKLIVWSGPNTRPSKGCPLLDLWLFSLTEGEQIRIDKAIQYEVNREKVNANQNWMFVYVDLQHLAYQLSSMR
jgi:hypothetical protein